MRKLIVALSLLVIGGCVTNIRAKAVAACSAVASAGQGAYNDCVASVAAQYEEKNRRTARILAAGLGGAARSAVSSQPQGVFRRDFVSGTNRVCVYDDMGSARYVTIPVTQLCPLQ